MVNRKCMWCQYHKPRIKLSVELGPGRWGGVAGVMVVD